MMRNYIRCFLAVVLCQTCQTIAVQADEIDDALRVEATAEAEGAVTPAGGMVLEPSGQDGPAVAGEMQRPLSQLSREELEAELMAARAEVDRLKDIVRRIFVANRREKQAMHYNIGCVFRAAGQYHKAEQAFLDALALNPNDPAVHYNLGILYDEDLGRPDKAKKHYQAFLDLAPNDEDAGRVYQWLTALQ